MCAKSGISGHQGCLCFVIHLDEWRIIRLAPLDIHACDANLALVGALIFLRRFILQKLFYSSFHSINFYIFLQEEIVQI